MAENPFLWSTTAADNDDADPAVPWPEGMLPGAVNNGARAIMAAMARYIKDLNGTVATTGSSNAYLATSNCDHSAYVNGAVLTVRANHTNTGAATLDLNSFGAKAIRIFTPSGETALAGGEIQNTGTYQLRYDAALNSAAGAWLLLNPTVTERVGTIKLWPSDTLPAAHLWANGEAVSSTTYANLYTAIGTVFNTGGEGAGNFRLPDLCGRVPAGSDDMGGISSKNRLTNADDGLNGDTLGATGGGETQTLVRANLTNTSVTVDIASGQGSHQHANNIASPNAVTSPRAAGGLNDAWTNTDGFFSVAAATLPAMTGTFNLNGNVSQTAFGIVQPTIIINYIIRY